MSTAGRVLRNSHLPVAPAVAEHVRKVALRLGYVPNLLARNLRGAQPNMIGLVVGDMLDPYYGTVAEAVTERAEAEHGMLAVVCNIQRNPMLELKYCRQMWEHRVRGLILTGGGFDQHQCAAELGELTRAMETAGVIITTLGPRFIDVPMFCVDNELAGRMAAMQLVEAGHRHVAVVTGSIRSETGRLRLAGCLTALTKRRLRVSEVHVPYAAEPVGKALLDLMAEQPEITGIIATSDFMSQTVFDWLSTRGIAVPREMSVVGMRGTPLASLARQLTSVDVRIADSSRAALDYIAARAAGKAPRVTLLEPVLLKGETLGAPR